ncbi:MAG: TRAP transporter substrate-binding protein [Dehalococcoidales bacterium]|jgi:TRAP-type C4-dicarboxylate transport system substrate-binding protein|nr:TRAP transporter substrate-binding protein [Dehalococcoidales bacterium]
MVLVSLLLTLALILSACSSTKTPATSGNTPSTTAPTTTQASPVTASQTKIKLIASCYLPPAHMMSGLMGDMLKEIETLSNGRLEITYASGGSILTGPKTADGIEQGLADIGLSHIGYTPGRFPITEALDLPVGYSSSWVGTNVALDFLAKYKPKEWDNFHILLVDGGTTASINMAKTPIRKLEDFQGKTMRGAGEVADALKALGATPRDIPMSEVYEAMSKGTIDGLLVGAESLKSFKLADVTKYTTYAPSIGNQYLFYIAINKKKWDSLGPDLQKIFTDVCAKYQPESAVGWNKINVLGFQQAISQGAEFITIPDDEAARWKAAVAPVIDAYIKKIVDKGLATEQQARDMIAFIKERMAYWDRQQIEQHIPSEADIK